MKLHSLKQSKAQAKKDLMPTMAGDSADAYPWGTRINLDEALLAKIPELAAMTTDDTGTLQAKFTVIRSSSEATAGGKKRRSMELQLTSLGVESSESFDGGWKEGEE